MRKIGPLTYSKFNQQQKGLDPDAPAHTLQVITTGRYIFTEHGIYTKYQLQGHQGHRESYLCCTGWRGALQSLSIVMEKTMGDIL